MFLQMEMVFSQAVTSRMMLPGILHNIPICSIIMPIKCIIKDGSFIEEHMKIQVKSNCEDWDNGHSVEQLAWPSNMNAKACIRLRRLNG